MSTLDDPEAAISACVEHFYALALADDDLGPMFRAAIPDIPEHLQVIRDFWSNALLGTKRYSGSSYAKHVHLPIELKHFDRWLTLFETAARADLPAELADRAMKRARHMSESLRSACFPSSTPKAGPRGRRPHPGADVGEGASFSAPACWPSFRRRRECPGR